MRTQNTPKKTSITQVLQTDLERSFGVTLVIPVCAENENNQFYKFTVFTIFSPENHERYQSPRISILCTVLY